MMHARKGPNIISLSFFSFHLVDVYHLSVTDLGLWWQNSAIAKGYEVYQTFQTHSFLVCFRRKSLSVSRRISVFHWEISQSATALRAAFLASEAATGKMALCQESHSFALGRVWPAGIIWVLNWTPDLMWFAILPGRRRKPRQIDRPHTNWTDEGCGRYSCVFST